MALTGDFFRETHASELSGHADNIAFITCPNIETCISGGKNGNIAVGRGFVNSSFFGIQVIFPYTEIAKLNLNFWPVRDHEKPSFRYVPSTFFPLSVRLFSEATKISTDLGNKQVSTSQCRLCLGSHVASPAAVLAMPHKR